MPRGKLVRELLPGPIDLVGDVHGEMDALRALLRRMGYDERGRHPEGRRLVFVGDLADRGPDSPGVVMFVRGLVEAGLAQSVMGNHEFNALRARAGAKLRTEHSWLFSKAKPYSHDGRPVTQRMAGRQANAILDFFATLPLALERGGEMPVRVVHAGWDARMVDLLRDETDAVAAYNRHAARIEAEMARDPGIDEDEAELRHQNGNPVKLLTSGHETRSSTPIKINGRDRFRVRLPWWRDYADQPLTVVGHYWRVGMPGDDSDEHLFGSRARNMLLGAGHVMCIDYSVGRRFRERMEPGFRGLYLTSLGALRLPERMLHFDNADPQPLAGGEPG
ncbi:MAG: metallophosphoesterase [Gemmataceae bacterium]|nr:metallophosphoesterase [Gemmataceae bacterium]